MHGVSTSPTTVLRLRADRSMDETADYFEDARPTTLDYIGARHVVVRSTRFSYIRIMVVLTVSATGRKLLPLLVCKVISMPTFEKTRVRFTWLNSLVLEWIVSCSRSGLISLFHSWCMAKASVWGAGQYESPYCEVSQHKVRFQEDRLVCYARGSDALLTGWEH